MNDFLTMFYETLFGIFALFIFTKILGKTQISQLTPFDFIAAIILGELIGNALFDDEAGIIDIGYVVFIWGVILYVIEIIAQKFKGSRFILEGKPAILIYDGKIQFEILKKNKLNINELLQLLRMKDIFSLQEVAYAVLEANGELSVLKKTPFMTPTNHDLNISIPKPQLAATIISDGEFINDNITELNLTEAWVKEEISKRHYKDVNEILYAEYLAGQPLFILPYQAKSKLDT